MYDCVNRIFTNESDSFLPLLFLDILRNSGNHFTNFIIKRIMKRKKSGMVIMTKTVGKNYFLTGCL